MFSIFASSLRKLCASKKKKFWENMFEILLSIYLESKYTIFRKCPYEYVCVYVCVRICWYLMIYSIDFNRTAFIFSQFLT